MIDKTTEFNELYVKTFIKGDVKEVEIKELINKMFYLLDNYEIDISNTQLEMLKLAQEEFLEIK